VRRRPQEALMLRSIVVLMLASMTMDPAGCSAQAPADFSGRWTVDQPAPAEGAAAASIRGDMGSG